MIDLEPPVAALVGLAVYAAVIVLVLLFMAGVPRVSGVVRRAADRDWDERGGVVAAGQGSRRPDRPAASPSRSSR